MNVSIRNSTGYPIGTFREDIWHDIEDQLEVPIHELMFPDDVNKDMTNERSLTMSNENKNTNVKEETTWTNFKFFNNQVKLKVIEKDDRQMYLQIAASCRVLSQTASISAIRTASPAI